MRLQNFHYLRERRAAREHKMSRAPKRAIAIAVVFVIFGFGIYRSIYPDYYGECVTGLVRLGAK